MGKTKRKKRTIARICSMIGVSLLILVILICIDVYKRQVLIKIIRDRKVSRGSKEGGK